jgi:hypothetical protein
VHHKRIIKFKDNVTYCAEAAQFATILRVSFENDFLKDIANCPVGKKQYQKCNNFFNGVNFLSKICNYFNLAPIDINFNIIGDAHISVNNHQKQGHLVYNYLLRKFITMETVSEISGTTLASLPGLI